MHAFFFARLKTQFSRTLVARYFAIKHVGSANIPMNQLQRNDFLVQMCYGLLNFV